MPLLILQSLSPIRRDPPKVVNVRLLHQIDLDHHPLDYNFLHPVCSSLVRTAPLIRLFCSHSWQIVPYKTLEYDNDMCRKWPRDVFHLSFLIIKFWRLPLRSFHFHSYLLFLLDSGIYVPFTTGSNSTDPHAHFPLDHDVQTGKYTTI